MTNTLVLAGKSAEPRKQPKVSYVANKAFIIEVCWWRRLAQFPPAFAEHMEGKVPDYPKEPTMREARFCQNEDEADAFLDHCKKYRALLQDGAVVKMTYAIYSLTPHKAGTYEQSTER